MTATCVFSGTILDIEGYLSPAPSARNAWSRGTSIADAMREEHSLRVRGECYARGRRSPAFTR
jgi:hypothetical protein